MDLAIDRELRKNIIKLIGDVSSFELEPVVESSFATIDGRVQGTILGTPGGDAGEFVLALQIYSEMMGPDAHLTKDHVLNILKDYLSYMKQNTFYFASDDSAVQHLQKQLGVIGLDLESPREQYKSELRKVLAQPENVGDLHFKELLTESITYAVNKTLVECFVHAFYELLWQGNSKVHLDILAGHTGLEQAFLEVKTDMNCLKQNRALKIKAHTNEFSVFVNHDEAVSLKRAELAKFFTQHVSHSATKSDTETMFNRLNHRGTAYLELTGSRVARNLPFYTVTFV